MADKPNKLKTKDLIIAGAFAALYIVVFFAVVATLGFIPVTYLLSPFVNGIVLGCVYMVYVAKLPKFGAILILAVAVGLFTSIGGLWFALAWCLALGLAAELIARAGRYRSKRAYQLSYMIFACTGMGPFWMLVLAKPAFLAACTAYYGADYAATIDRYTPSWSILVLIALAMLGGLSGALIGSRLMKKHFRKAGVV